MEKIDRNLLLPIVRRAVFDCVAANRSPQTEDGDPSQMFHSPEANALKEEILRAGKKLWDRQYVDGNGGNISVRLSPHFVLCTPTLCSKADLSMEDLSLVDLDNNRICGERPQTSEILLHLEIYKAVPTAKAVIHCHPPYATAHAIAGMVPQGNLLPEQEVFVGPVALAPYETPGTREFARTVLPYVEDHNTILLTNHGIVCWGDTVTHAEWYVEVVETYCKTVMIAAQLRPQLTAIPTGKIPDLLALKNRLGLGLPDARQPKRPEANRTADTSTRHGSESQIEDKKKHLDKHELEELIHRVTQEVAAFLDGDA